ncbi:MAG: hypothetical protein AB9897_08905 [Anaerolineaceae bacterium]
MTYLIIMLFLFDVAHIGMLIYGIHQHNKDKLLEVAVFANGCPKCHNKSFIVRRSGGDSDYSSIDGTYTKQPSSCSVHCQRCNYAIQDATMSENVLEEIVDNKQASLFAVGTFRGYYGPFFGFLLVFGWITWGLPIILLIEKFSTR